jgi:rhamnogalacturonan endolyase
MLVSLARADAQPVSVVDEASLVTLDNGLLRLVIDKTTGRVRSFEAMLQGEFVRLSDPARANALYVDWNGSSDATTGEQKARAPRAGYGGPSVRLNRVTVAEQTPDAATVIINAGPTDFFPFNVQFHLRLARGEPMLYAWVVYTHEPEMPGGLIEQTRLVLRAASGTERFTHHIVDDTRQNPIPTGTIIETVQDATSRYEDGSVYTKYDNTAFTKDFVAHGMTGDGVGLWVLWPSTEFCNGGPLRQDLTVHTDGVLLAMFHSAHFGAPKIRVEHGERWTKLAGPVVFYVNEGPDITTMWNDAVTQTHALRARWPFTWLRHPDYPLERGVVRGRVTLADGSPAADAWAVLSPVEPVDWALSARGYQFWTRVGADGAFEIPSVRPGTYRLNVSGANQFVDFEHAPVEVKPGSNELGSLVWTPTTHGRTLWQVGDADRSTGEFMDGENPRNYETYLRYFKAFPDDVIFTIGQSDPKRDWYYAHWSWFNTTPRRTIRFDVDQPLEGRATLTVGISAREYAAGSEVVDVGQRATVSGSLIVRLNGEPIATFTGPKTGAAGYRSASQDSPYILETVTFDASRLRPGGMNEITFEHEHSAPFPRDEAERRRAKRPRGSVMYDAIRLEVDER